MKDESMVMILINKRYATLKELETYYDFNDMLFLSACADIKGEIEATQW